MLDAALDLIAEIGTLEDARFLAGVGGWRNFSQPGHVKKWARQAARRIRKKKKEIRKDCAVLHPAKRMQMVAYNECSITNPR